MAFEELDQRAQDVALERADGSEVQLSRLWNDRTLVLVFLRHFG
jgi:hypothetical protein